MSREKIEAELHSPLSPLRSLVGSLVSILTLGRAAGECWRWLAGADINRGRPPCPARKKSGNSGMHQLAVGLGSATQRPDLRGELAAQATGSCDGRHIDTHRILRANHSGPACLCGRQRRRRSIAIALASLSVVRLGQLGNGTYLRSSGGFRGPLGLSCSDASWLRAFANRGLARSDSSSNMRRGIGLDLRRR